MDKKWVEERKASARKAFEKEKNRVYEAVKEFGKFKDGAKEKFLSDIKSLSYDDETDLKLTHLDIDLRYGALYVEEEFIEDYLSWYKKFNLETIFQDISLCDPERYLDSEPVSFDGDIIITDPCYIIRAEHHGMQPITHDDWETCNYGSNMEKLGIYKYMTRDTLYGDWSCTTFDSDTGDVLGKFCADAGLVSVFDLAEVLAYNPNFDYHTERTWTTTYIKNFKGTVQFVIEYIEGTYDDTTDYHKIGDKWEDFAVKVVGHGIDKVTGQPINFVGKQTGF